MPRKMVRFSAPSRILSFGVRLQARQVLRRRVEHEVDLAREQRGDARGVGLDRRVDDLGRRCRRGLPHQAGFCTSTVFTSGSALFSMNGPVPLALRVAKVSSLVLIVLRLDDVVLLGPGLAHDAQLGQLRAAAPGSGPW